MLDWIIYCVECVSSFFDRVKMINIYLQLYDKTRKNSIYILSHRTTVENAQGKHFNTINGVM